MCFLKGKILSKKVLESTGAIVYGISGNRGLGWFMLLAWASVTSGQPDASQRLRLVFPFASIIPVFFCGSGYRIYRQHRAEETEA
jgi:hypothetical protein